MITNLHNAIFESLKSFEQGQFQQFCKSLLPLIDPLYDGLESHGMTLDGKTRKGTPDLLKTFSSGKQIAVQCSVHKSYWKLPKKEISINSSKPCIDIDKCICHLMNLEEIILCSNQIIPTNAPNAKARIFKYARKKAKVPIKIFSAANICEILITNHHRNSFEELFKIFFPFFYETFISGLPKKRITWDELIVTCHSQVQTEIKSKIGNKYIPKLYVHREKEKEIATFIVSGTETLVGLYKNMQNNVNYIFERSKFYLIDLSLLDNHDAIFLPSPDRRRKIGFFLDNLSGNLKEKMELMKGKDLGSREKEIWAAMTTLQKQIDEMKRLLIGLFIIIDRAGSGKTNILCKIAEEYSKILPTILITGRIEIKDEFSIEKYVKTILDYYSDLPFQRCIEEINLLAAEKDSFLLIIIDGIDESRDFLSLEKAIANLVNMNIDKNIKVIVSCRDIYWNFFKDNIWEASFGKAENELYQLSEKEFQEALQLYFDHYHIECNLTGDARQKCRQPLLLRFFCETYGDPYSSVHIKLESITEIRLKELFDKYIQKKTDSISKRLCVRDNQYVLDYVFKIVHHMRERRLKAFLSSDIPKLTGEINIYSLLSIYTLILDEDIIIEERSIRGDSVKQVVFVYEEFMEYVMAKEIIVDLGWLIKNEKVVNAELDAFIQEYRNYGNLLGILEYLGIMLKEERNFNIFSVLTKYPKEYGLTICKGIQKLPLNYIDTDMAITLESLLDAMKTPSTKIGEAIIYILVKSGKEWGEEIIGLLSRLILFKSNSIFIPAIIKLVEMRTRIPFDVLNKFLVTCIKKCGREEDYHAEKLVIAANIFVIKDFQEGIPILIQISKSININVVKESIRALGMIGGENVIPTLLLMIPEIYNRGHRDDSGEYDFKYFIREIIEEIINSLEWLVRRGVVKTDLIRNLVHMILIDRKKPERMLEIFSLEHLSSIPIHEIEKFLMPVGFIPFQETAVEKFELSLAVRRALGMLTPREEKIVRMRFGIDERAEHSWVELGELFDVSQSTIKRIYKNAFKKLKNPPISKLLKPFYNDYQLEPDRNFKLIN